MNKPILQTVAANPENQDRGVVIQDGPRVVLCVADGAGGRSGGTEAATLAVKLVRENASLLNDASSCAELLRQMDTTIANDREAGETTCALAVLTSNELFGASVGDSGIWLISETGDLNDLTQNQQRRPFIGSGSAWAVPFEHSNPRGILLLATDGLIKYTSAEHIVATCLADPADVAAPKLIGLVRYASGALPDDVTLILCPVIA
jgi:serine/threonine protein phosphatase PrpC